MQKVNTDSQLRDVELYLLIPLDNNWGVQLSSYLCEEKLIIQQAIDIEKYSNTNKYDWKNLKIKYEHK